MQVDEGQTPPAHASAQKHQCLSLPPLQCSHSTSALSQSHSKRESPLGNSFSAGDGEKTKLAIIRCMFRLLELR